MKYAIQTKANSVADYLMTAPGIDLTRRDADGVNAFWYACASKNLHVVRKMLEAGRGGKSPADVTAQHPEIGNAMHLCT